jgi:hypothetical protein
MYTLKDIYQRLASGQEGALLYGSEAPHPSNSELAGNTIDEIVKVAPMPVQADAARTEDVRLGKAFWGLNPNGGWGQRVGTAGTELINKNGDCLLDSLDKYDWLATATVGDLWEVKRSEDVPWPLLLHRLDTRLKLIAIVDSPALEIGRRVLLDAYELDVLLRLSRYDSADRSGIVITFADLCKLAREQVLDDALMVRIIGGEDIDSLRVTSLPLDHGKLTPRGPPTSAESIMYTLDDLYARLSHGAEVSKASRFRGPSAAPGASGPDLNEIMSISPYPDGIDGATPEDIASGRTYWGVHPASWGKQTGVLHEGAATPARTLLDPGRYDWLSKFAVREIWDAVDRSAVSGVQEFLDLTDAKIQAIRSLNTPSLAIPLRIRYNPDEQELIERLTALMDEGLLLDGIRSSFADLAALHGAGRLADDYLRNFILSGRVVDSSFIDDPIAYLNAKQPGLIPLPSGETYTSFENAVIDKMAWLAANGVVDLASLAKVSLGQLVAVAEDSGYGNLSVEEIVYFFGCPIALKSDMLIFNPKFLSDVPLSFHIGTPGVVDEIVIQAESTDGTVTEMLYSGGIQTTDLTLRWDGRSSAGGFVSDGTYRFTLLAKRYGNPDSAPLMRHLTWGSPAPQSMTMKVSSGLADVKNMGSPPSGAGVLVSTSWVGDWTTGTEATSDSSLDFYNENLRGRILKFEIVDGLPEVNFYNGVDKKELSSGVGAGAWVSSFDAFEFRQFLPGQIRMVHEEYGGIGRDWFGTDTCKSKLYELVDGQWHQKLFLTELGGESQTYEEGAAGKYRVTYECDGWVDAWGRATVYYSAPSVYKASGSCLTNISEVSHTLFGPLLEKLQNTNTNSVGYGAYTYTCEPPLVDVHGNGTVAIRRENATDTSDLSYLEIEGTFESGDIHLNTDGTNLWLCWLGASPDGDLNRRVPKIQKVVLAEQDDYWLPASTERILQWARNRGVNFPEDQSESDVALLDLLKNGDGGTNGVLTVPAPHDCYNNVPLDRIQHYLGTNPITSTNATAAYCLAFMEENPLRFWYEGNTLADLDEAGRMTATEAIIGTYSPSDLVKALDFGVRVGVGEDPNKEPEVTLNQFNSSNGLQLQETDLEINYMGEPVYSIVRSYDSGGARFRPSFVGVNREKEVLSNFFTERTIDNLLPLKLKSHVSGLGSGWGLSTDGSVLINYMQFRTVDPDTDPREAENGLDVSISVSLHGRSMSFRFQTEDSDRFDDEISEGDFEPQNRHLGYRLVVRHKNGSLLPHFNSPHEWMIELIDPQGSRYSFEEKAVDFNAETRGEIYNMTGGFVKRLWRYNSSKIAFKLTEERRLNGLQLTYDYWPLEEFSTGPLSYTKQTDLRTGDAMAKSFAASWAKTAILDLAVKDDALKSQLRGSIQGVEWAYELANGVSVEDLIVEEATQMAINVAVDAAAKAIPGFGVAYMAAQVLLAPSEFRFLQDYALSYRMPRLYQVRIGRVDLENGATNIINTLNFTYRNHFHSFVLPDAHKALQVKKIVSRDVAGQEKEIWYRYDNFDMLKSVEVNRDERAVYDYERYDSDMLGASWLLSSITYRNGATRQFEYELHDLRTANLHTDLVPDPLEHGGDAPAFTEDERRSASQYQKKREVLNLTQISTWDYDVGAVNSYLPFEDEKQSRAFYFTGITKTRPDGTVVELDYENGLPTQQRVAAVNFLETNSYDWQERWLTSRTVNDHGQVTRTVFSDHDEETGIPQRTATTDVAAQVTEVESKELADVAGLLDVNMLGLPAKESREFLGKLRLDVNNEFFSGDFHADTNPGYPGALKKTVATEDLSKRAPLSVGNFLPGRNVSSIAYTYDSHGRVRSMTSELSKVDYAYVDTTDPVTGAGLLKQEATTTIWYNDLLGPGQQRVDTGQYTSSRIFDLATGRLVSETDMNGGTTTYEYENDKLVKKRYPDTTTEIWDYDFRNRTVTYADRNGVRKTDALDTEGRVVSTDFASPLLADTTRGYDVNGNPVRTETVYGDTSLFVDAWRYDSRDRPLSMHNSRGETLNFDYLPNNIVSVVRDGKKREKTETDSFGGTESIIVEEMAGRVVRDVDVVNDYLHKPASVAFSGGVLGREFENDAGETPVLEETEEGLQRTSITGTGFVQNRRGVGNQVAEDVLTMLDGLGRPVMTKEKGAIGWRELRRYRYDEAIASRFGNAADYQMGKLTTATTPHTANRFIYGVNGNLLEEQIDILSRSFSVGYDWEPGQVGLLAGIEVKGSGGAAGQQISYEYDEVGRMGALTVVVNGDKRRFEFAYEPDARLKKIRYPNGVSVTRKYDSPSRNLHRIEMTHGDELLRSVDYAYEAGLITERSDYIGIAGVTNYVRRQLYERDAEGCLVKVVNSDSSGATTTDTFDYDDNYSIRQHTVVDDSSQTIAKINYNYGANHCRLITMEADAGAESRGWSDMAVGYDPYTLRPR